LFVARQHDNEPARELLQRVQNLAASDVVPRSDARADPIDRDALFRPFDFVTGVADTVPASADKGN